MFYKHKGYLCGIGVVIIERGLDVMNIITPDWLGPLLLVIGIGIIVWTAYMAWKGRQQVTDQTNSVVERPLATTSNILQIERQETSNRPPLWLSITGTVTFLLLLAFGLWVTYFVLSGIIIAKFNLEWIAFYLLFGVFPILMLIAPFTFDRKYYKSGRSATAIDVTFVVSGDITDVFNKCFNILETMKAKIIRKNTPNLIKGGLNKSNISIEVRPSDDNVKVYVISDATWVTVKVGKERNQRIIDEFQKHFIDAFRVSKLDNAEQSLSLTKALDWVTCDKCGFIGVRNIKTRELEEVEDNQRETGQPLLTRINSLGDTEPRHEKIPECIMQAEDFATLPPLSSQPLPLFYMQLPRQCTQFIKWQKGSSPKEHKKGSQSLGDGIQPKSYDKRDVIISNEPEISIDIDKCSWGNSVIRDNQSVLIVEVALTLEVKSPPVNITDLQLYMEDEMLKLLSPAMPITQENKRRCYIAEYELTTETIYKVPKDKRDKFYIRAVTKRQEVNSEVFLINNP